MTATYASVDELLTIGEELARAAAIHVRHTTGWRPAH